MHPFECSASSAVGLRTDSSSAVNGAVAPVVTKQSLESDVHFQESAMMNKKWNKKSGDESWGESWAMSNG